MIYINYLRKEVGMRTLFEIDGVTINEKDKIGLIGDNGVGKTSLLRILSGKDSDYIGDVKIQSKIDSLLNEDNNPDIYKNVDLKSTLDNKSLYSPGEYQRLKVTNLLLNEVAFLLIDEPTSHLDITQKEKLSKCLFNRDKGYILISHDRDFINQTCDKIFELSNGNLEIFNGDYSFYLEEKEKRKKFSQREYEKYITEKKRLANIVQNVEVQSSKVRTTPKRMGNSEARLHKMGGQQNKKKLDKQLKAVESRINQLEVKEKPKEKRKIKLVIEEKDKIFSKILVKEENLSKRFGEKILFDNARLEIENNSKIALLGDNGSGKTTLLNMILNKDVWVHPNVKIGYYSQLGEIIEFNKTILENILETTIYDQSLTRIVLARLGFKSDDVDKTVDILSDGERAKVKLAKLLTSDFNFLIMDEPTNFLDITAIEALEDLLIEYDRALLFVTHDVSFINNVANRLVMIKEHKIRYFQGNLSQFKIKRERSKTKLSSNDLLIDFRLVSINNRLVQDISKEERKELEAEYNILIQQRGK